MESERPYWVDDPVMDEVRTAHRLNWEPADDDHCQLYLASCSAGDWEAGRPLDASAVQEEWDLHMGRLQDEQRRSVVQASG
ncbi:hypothetical protein [Streptomyces albogriseolus]|uniref:hypothetical protein n=1 Tax=Streptomyces albogriseolus TaxID=1887 RepID=UPI00346012A4